MLSLFSFCTNLIWYNRNKLSGIHAFTLLEAKLNISSDVYELFIFLISYNFLPKLPLDYMMFFLPETVSYFYFKFFTLCVFLYIEMFWSLPLWFMSYGLHSLKNIKYSPSFFSNHASTLYISV